MIGLISYILQSFTEVLWFRHDGVLLSFSLPTKHFPMCWAMLFPSHKADVWIVLEKNCSGKSLLYCPSPASSVWNQVRCIILVRHRILCCFSYMQLSAVQEEGRAEQLCVRGWLVLSALNRLSWFNPSQQQRIGQPLNYSLPCQPHQEWNQKSWSEELVSWEKGGLVGVSKAVQASKAKQKINSLLF